MVKDEFICDYSKLSVFFNEFHDFVVKDLPEYGEYCLLELKDGRYTAGEWLPQNYEDKKSKAGKFNRGTGDSVDGEEVVKYHSLGYDLSNCLKKDLDYINNGPRGEGIHSVEISGFKSFKDGDFPGEEQFCLLIMNDGTLAAGRWNSYGEDDGAFIYASALASHSMDKVWAWAPLSSDDIFEREQEDERERLHEEELNKNPKADPNKFIYGTDIDTYYEKACKKLKKTYPWATINQMKKVEPGYDILPLHVNFVFGQDGVTFNGSRIVHEWTDGSTADEFIDFLCKYTKSMVKDSDPEKKFALGYDIDVYLEKAFNKVKKKYTWLTKKIAGSCRYDIRQINGEWEFVREYDDASASICNYGSSEDFIECVADDYRSAALRANTVVSGYKVNFGSVEIHGWHLEQYVVSKLSSGDYKVNVTAGDRVTGGSREFFITPDCFEAKTYDEFLDRYEEIVPGHSFGLYKEDLLKDEGLKKFLGY